MLAQPERGLAVLMASEPELANAASALRRFVPFVGFSLVNLVRGEVAHRRLKVRISVELV